MPVKIDPLMAAVIRELVRQGVTQKEVSYRTGLSKSAISMIVANKVWKQKQEPEHV